VNYWTRLISTTYLPPDGFQIGCLPGRLAERPYSIGRDLPGDIFPQQNVVDWYPQVPYNEHAICETEPWVARNSTPQKAA